VRACVSSRRELDALVTAVPAVGRRLRATMAERLAA
jgi:hypothetical protein